VFILFLNAVLTFGACQTRTALWLYNMISSVVYHTAESRQLFIQSSVNSTSLSFV